MDIEITTIVGRVAVLRIDCRLEGRKCGDLIEEWHSHENNRPVKAIVVGVNYSAGRVWTVSELNKEFKASYWTKPHVLNHTKLVKRPHSPDLTIEGLKRSLEDFINKDQ